MQAHFEMAAGGSGSESDSESVSTCQSILYEPDTEPLMDPQIVKYLNDTMESAKSLMGFAEPLGELYKVCPPTGVAAKSLWDVAGLPATKVSATHFIKCVTDHTLANFTESTRNSIRHAGGWFAYLLTYLEGPRREI